MNPHPGRIVVVGLGPGEPGLLTTDTRLRLERAHAQGRLWLRTTRHPAASVVAGAPSFDDVYEAADRLDDVYPRIVERLVAAAGQTDAEITYAVPGSPVVAERTVELLVAGAADRSGPDIEIVAALSFLDLAWARLGIDPIARGVRVIDGQRFAVEAAGQRGPLLVAQCDSRSVLSAVKLALDAGLEPSLAPDARVIVLQGLGTDQERIFEVAGAELDRQVEADHLTTVYLPELAAPVAGELTRLVELVATLRVECPWDAKQTHQSLRRHLLEESYEVLEAIDELTPEPAAGQSVAHDSGSGYDPALEHLEEELGDLLFQIAFHSQLATEEGGFTLADVARGVHDKLVARHPHVFGDVQADTAQEVVANWEQIKKAEKGRDSVFDGIPAAMPALLYALKIQKKAESLDLGPDLDLDMDVDLDLDLDRLDDAAFGARLGDLLYGIVDRARRAGIDPEDTLRASAMRQRDRLRAAELSD